MVIVVVGTIGDFGPDAHLWCKQTSDVCGCLVVGTPTVVVRMVVHQMVIVIRPIRLVILDQVILVHLLQIHPIHPIHLIQVVTLMIVTLTVRVTHQKSQKNQEKNVRKNYQKNNVNENDMSKKQQNN